MLRGSDVKSTFPFPLETDHLVLFTGRGGERWDPQILFGVTSWPSKRCVRGPGDGGGRLRSTDHDSLSRVGLARASAPAAALGALHPRGARAARCTPIGNAVAAFSAQGYEVVFAGQGSWGCFAYIWMRDDLGTIIELLDHGNLACRAPS